MDRLSVVVMVLCACAYGCSGPNAQLTNCQADKDQLLATIREQRDANRSLHEQVASLDARLGESEKELARRGGPATRLSSRPVEESKLPWRAGPDRKSEIGSRKSEVGDRNSKVADIRPPTSDVRLLPSNSPTGSLAALAARDERLKLDAKSGVANLNVDLAFEENSANLTAAARRELDGVAKLLKAKDAANLRVLVSGYAEGRPPKTGEGAFTSARQLGAARAQAVADYLDRHGIAEERLGVTGVGSRVAAAATKTAKSGVQIYLAEPETPLVGWGADNSTIRR